VLPLYIFACPENILSPGDTIVLIMSLPSACLSSRRAHLRRKSANGLFGHVLDAGSSWCASAASLQGRRGAVAEMDEAEAVRQRAASVALNVDSLQRKLHYTSHLTPHTTDTTTCAYLPMETWPWRCWNAHRIASFACSPSTSVAPIPQR
jgi:hypothetical protein